MKGEHKLEPLKVHTIINQYEITEWIEQSAYEITYKCRDLNLMRDCILKEYAPDAACTRTSDQSLFALNERLFLNGYSEFIAIAQRIAMLDHPNIVHVYDLFKANGTVYISMEYIVGEQLSTIFEKRGGPFEEVEIFSLLYPLSDAILAIHKKELIHRNICPENIMIREDNSPVIIDFGMSTDFSGTFVDEQAGRVLKTSCYSSPEMFDPKIAKFSFTDIYSFGAILYRMISGAEPVSGDKRQAEDTLKCAIDAGDSKFARRLLQMIDTCMKVDHQVRCLYMDQIIRYFDTYSYKEIKNEYSNVLIKAVQHFFSFAKPNDGLYTDELVTLLIGFGIIDLTWRLTPGKLINQVLFEKLVSQHLIDKYLSIMEERGFKNKRRTLTPEILKSRLEEYAAAYLLDRQAEVWTYSFLLDQSARYCLTDQSDAGSFKDLLFKVIERYVFKIKKVIRDITDEH